MNENSLKKFQELLRTLFQFDCVDLDFGIYRILNYKRSQVEAFITERLPQVVEQAFARYAAADKAAVDQELEQKRQEIVKTLGEQAIDESGQLRNYHKTKLGQQYLLLLEKRVRYQVAEDLKTRVYNDLFTFFSRYYEDGDFVSKRRYGRHETYAIPYNGEEVVLYWANRDQYYVKTGERFKAYRFKAGDYAVTFELRNVAPEQNGNGGKKRYFVLAHEAPVTWNEQEKALAIAFEYRPLAEAEEKEHGRMEQQKPQDSLNEAAEKKIFGLVADDGLKVGLAKPEGTNGWSLLHKHLTRFTRRNTADFFVHKDLRGFLRRELDFFIKNEVLLLDELIGGREKDLREHVQRGQVVRQVAEAIIEFLAQVEDFQKRLWEKRKFVLRTEYCLTIDRVPEELWDEVLANEAQLAEWRQLYALDDLMKAQPLMNTGLNKEFLKAHPTLVMDTRHFPEEFKWQLLAHFDDLDEALDGLLIKSENWQALNLLLEKYREKAQSIYIDPPYNTSASPILYKNEYKDSSWLTLMEDRVRLGKHFLKDSGIQCTTIDDTEFHRLRALITSCFGDDNIAGVVAIKNNPSGRSTVKGFSIAHEYAIFSFASQRSRLGMIPRTPEQAAQYDKHDEKGAFQWRSFLRSGGANDFRTARPKLHYPLVISGMTVRLPKMQWNPILKEWKITEALHESEEIMLPTVNGIEYTWRLGTDSLKKRMSDVRVRATKEGKKIIEIKFRSDEEGVLPKTIWDTALVNATAYGTSLLRDIIGVPQSFSFPKSVYAVKDSLIVCAVDWESVVLDYFAGSGTTAHAVIDLNREDGGKRKYILVETGDWFETVMLPRIKKVVFREKWKDGKPQGGPGISHMLKYQYLEQYEDTLNNLELPRQAEGQKMLEMFGDEYLLKYMLEFETQGSPCLLSLDMFKDPFAYKLKVLEGDEIVEHPVDLVETFNYLLGIQVKKMRAFQDNGHPYRAILGEKNGKRVAIIWRSVVGLEDNEEVLMRDKAYIEQTVLPALLGKMKPDRLLVNGACFVKDAEAIEPAFKRLMFAPVGA